MLIVDILAAGFEVSTEDLYTEFNGQVLPLLTVHDMGLGVSGFAEFSLN